MKQILFPLQPRFEETEAIATIDLLRRADIGVITSSITSDVFVTGSHSITVKADTTLQQFLASGEAEKIDGIILPGGPGTPALGECAPLMELIRVQHSKSHLVAAICAAPTILSHAGVLEGKRATSFPRVRDNVHCREYLEDAVVVDGNVVTSRGAGTAIQFGLALIAHLCGQEAADRVAEAIVYTR